MLKRLFTFLFLTLCLSVIFAQNPYPTDFFRNPTDGPLNLAGNFGEIRPNHLHAGFDVKTNNQEGKPIYAVADGFVSRIKISPYGYGKVMYVAHANGYTSVYAHLSKFNGAIGEFVKSIQTSKQSFEMDTVLTVPAISVKKGDIIALSGNTGGSMGPHLHFEIRDSKTEMPINPYFFGFKVKDNVKPVITDLAIYPLAEDALINGKGTVKKIKPISSPKGGYSVKPTDTLTVYGNIGFAIECYDTETGSSNKNGVFSVELQEGGKRIYYHQFETFTFENSRYVNTHIDYKEKLKHDKKLQKCYLSKNNQLGIYKDVVNNGAIDFSDDATHWITFIVKDFVGNTTEMMLKVKSNSKGNSKKAVCGISPYLFDCLKENQFKKEDIELLLQPNSLYEDLKFNHYRSPKLPATFSMVHHVQDKESPLQKPYTISIKAEALPENLQSKAAIVSVSSKGVTGYEGGTYKNGWVSTQIKSFGNFAVGIDTIAPVIKPVFNAKDKKNVDLTKAKTIGIKVDDNLSGIKKYKATIDGQWVLFEYEAKQDLLFYTFDDKIQPGRHTFEIQVNDDKQNTARWSCEFVR